MLLKSTFSDNSLKIQNLSKSISMQIATTLLYNSTKSIITLENILY